MLERAGLCKSLSRNATYHRGVQGRAMRPMEFEQRSNKHVVITKGAQA